MSPLQCASGIRWTAWAVASAKAIEAAVMFSYTSKNWWANCPQTMVSSYVNCCYKYGNGYDFASTGSSTEKTKHSWDVQGNNQRITIGIAGNCYRVRCVRDIPD